MQDGVSFVWIVFQRLDRLGCWQHQQFDFPGAALFASPRSSPELPGWTKETLDRKVLEMGPDFKPTIASRRDELLEIFDKGVAAARERIAKATDSDWQVNWTFRFAGKDVISMPRAAVV